MSKQDSLSYTSNPFVNLSEQIQTGLWNLRITQATEPHLIAIQPI